MAKNQFDTVIFKNIKFSNILEDIYNNSKKKATDIDAMITELRKLIATPQDAMLIVPMIASYLGNGIDNDSQLIKMSQIIQRAISRDIADKSNNNPTTTMFSESELRELEEMAKNMLPEPPLNNIPIPIVSEIKQTDKPAEQ
jgi:hypothetical protein